MNRLTNWKDAHAFFPKCFEEPCGGGGCTRDDCEFLYRACEKLARYEDSGLEPEEIMGLCEMDKRTKMAKMLRWEDAERDGRLVILNKDCTNEDGEKALRKAMWECTVTNNTVTRYTADAIAEKLTREEAEAALEATG